MFSNDHWAGRCQESHVHHRSRPRARSNCWLDRLDAEGLSTGEGLVAFRLLPQVLESLVVLRARISEQRAGEARDVKAQMRENLEPLESSPRIEDTLALLRKRFETQ